MIRVRRADCSQFREDLVQGEGLSPPSEGLARFRSIDVMEAHGNGFAAARDLGPVPDGDYLTGESVDGSQEDEEG